MPGPVLIVGQMRVGAEHVGRFREAASTLIAATRAEPGCLSYHFSEDVAEPGLFHVAERWADLAAIDAHNKTPHLAVFMGALPTMGLAGVRLARYETQAEHVLIQM